MHDDPPQVTPQRNLLVIVILGALSTVGPLAIDMYLPAFPQIASDLHTTAARIALSLSTFFVGISVGQIAYGPLLDRFGRRWPLYAGLTIFVLASLGCLSVTTVEGLIAMRLIQALGGCSAQVASMALVRDLFPVKDSAKIFALLMLMIGVSPLLAPTIGSILCVHYGWRGVFIALAAIGLAVLVASVLWLPRGRGPDHSVSLKLLPILRGFGEILRNRQFYTYTLAGSLGFASLLVFVAGSPIIFLDYYHVSAVAYGGIFALLSGSFVGGSQINLLLAKRYSSAAIFRTALTVQTVGAVVLLLCAYAGVLGLGTTIALFWVIEVAVGIGNPNFAALALAPFGEAAGRAAALFGCIEIGIGAIASAGLGLFPAQGLLPAAALLAVTTLAGLTLLTVSLRGAPES